MRPRLIITVGLLLLLGGLAAALVLGVRYTNTPGFCESCHIIEPYVRTWEQAPMANLPDGGRVTCIQCHFEPGVIGFARGKIYSFMKLIEYAGEEYETPPPSAELLTSSACLQCHGDVTTGGLRGRNVENPEAATYPRVSVTDSTTTLLFPHDFHVTQAQVSCSECHSGVMHGAELTGNRPQADNTPEFCASCHTGDTAPILFGEITPSGREHPGVPKIDTALWRNLHWKFTFGPGEIEGNRYEKIELETCLACHDDPTEAKNCKSCHFHSEPVFAASAEAQRDSAAPLIMFGLVVGIFLLTLLPYPGIKRRLFEGWTALVLAVAVLATDVYAFYRVIEGIFNGNTGRETGSVTVWAAYVLASASLLIFLFHQGVLMPSRRRKKSLK